MSLREEIENYIESKPNIERIHANDIVKLFETKLEETYQSDEILGYIGNEEVHHGITLFRDKIVEMLK